MSWIEYPIPEPDPRLVVNCLFTPDSTWKVQLTRNMSVSDTNFEAPVITNAIVQLWEDNIYLGACTHTSEGIYRLSLHPKPGSTYKLIASAPGFPEIEAIDSLPALPTEFEGYLDLSGPVPVTDELGNVSSSFRSVFTFKDAPNQNNYYRIGLALKDSFQGYLPDYQVSITDIFDDKLQVLAVGGDAAAAERVGLKNGIILMQDISFPGGLKTVNMYRDTSSIFNAYRLQDINTGTYYSSGGPTPIRPYIKLYADVWSMSQTLFTYYVTYLTQGYSMADPFAIYTNAYSNVTNGRGVFAGYQREQVFIYSN